MFRIILTLAALGGLIMLGIHYCPQSMRDWFRQADDYFFSVLMIKTLIAGFLITGPLVYYFQETSR